MSGDAQAQGASILVAEDESMVRMIAVETLRDAGFEVHEASDGAEALALLQKGVKVDLLISDIKMPRMNGYQLVEAGRALRPEMKVLLMTGYAQDPIPDSMTRAGIRVLYKPFNVDELSVLAQHALSGRPTTENH
jgi:CheY-like chemotaxis protein